jgi:multisubunit Na+/H+ antiporter MnhB subunit
VAAAGLDRLAGGRHGLWIPGVALAQLVLTGIAWARFVTALDAAWPWPGLAAAGALLAGALGLLGLALARLRPRGEPEPRPTAPRALESTHAA